MNGLVVIGGKCPRRKQVKQYLDNYDLVIAADSGFNNALKLKIKPDVLIGDLDSIKNKKILNKFKDLKILEYDIDKDLTDTELAIDYLFNNGFKHVTLLGGGEGRLDHVFALLYLFNRDKFPDKWLCNNEIIYCFDKELNLQGEIGDMISFFPVGKKECKMESFGLKWSLDSLLWDMNNFGISNCFSDTYCKVILKSGRLLAVKKFDSN